MTTSCTIAMSYGILLFKFIPAHNIMGSSLLILFYIILFSVNKKISWQNLANVPINLQVIMLKR